MPTFTEKVLSKLGLYRLDKNMRYSNAFSINSMPQYNQLGQPWESKGGHKGVMTEWFWQPIRGQPRRVDTNEIRTFAKTYWAWTCIQTLINEIIGLDWDIIVDEDATENQSAVNEVKNFFNNPNLNNQSFEEILRMLIKDILEIDAGVVVKVFTEDSFSNDKDEISGLPKLKPIGQRTLKEVYAYDGASFLKECDKHGFVIGFWQYSYAIPAHPMWFARDEIMYTMQHPRSMSPYGFSPTQAVLEILKTMQYSTEWNKKYFENNTIPDGILCLPEANDIEYERFRTWWELELKGQPHKMPIINKAAEFKPFTLSHKELEFLESQKWYQQLIASSYGLTPAELGFTQDVNRATSSTQAEVFRRKAIRPLLKTLEYSINESILPEFGYAGIKFKFIAKDIMEERAQAELDEIKLRMGTLTINEIRKREGKEPVAWGDKDNRMSFDMTQVTPTMPVKPKEDTYQDNTIEHLKEEDKAIEEEKKSRREVPPEAYGARQVTANKSISKQNGFKCPKCGNTSYKIEDTGLTSKEYTAYCDECGTDVSDIVDDLINKSATTELKKFQISAQMDEWEMSECWNCKHYPKNCPIWGEKRHSLMEQNVRPCPSKSLSNPLNSTPSTEPTEAMKSSWVEDMVKEAQVEKAFTHFKLDKLAKEVANIIEDKRISKSATKDKKIEEASDREVVSALTEVSQKLKESLKSVYRKGFAKAESELDINILADEVLGRKVDDAIDNKVGDMITNIDLDIRDNVKRVIKEGISNGWDNNKIAQALGQIEGLQGHNLKAIADTEASRAINQGYIDALKNTDVKYVKWRVYHQGEYPCDKCKAHENETISIKEANTGSLVIPLHTHCFCHYEALL